MATATKTRKKRENHAKRPSVPRGDARYVGLGEIAEAAGVTTMGAWKMVNTYKQFATDPEGRVLRSDFNAKFPKVARAGFERATRELMAVDGVLNTFRLFFEIMGGGDPKAALSSLCLYPEFGLTRLPIIPKEAP